MLVSIDMDEPQIWDGIMAVTPGQECEICHSDMDGNVCIENLGLEVVVATEDERL